MVAVCSASRPDHEVAAGVGARPRWAAAASRRTAAGAARGPAVEHGDGVRCPEVDPTGYRRNAPTTATLRPVQAADGHTGTRALAAPRRHGPVHRRGRGAAPAGTARPAGGGRRRRQPGPAAPGRGQRVVRGARFRRPLGHAARGGRGNVADAVFLPTDRAAYDAASATVMDTLRELPGDRSRCGAGTRRTSAARSPTRTRWRAELRAAVFAPRAGCPATIGIGDNKHQAKIAAQFGKPGGIFEITSANWSALMAARPVSALQGVGPKTAKKLDALGLRPWASWPRPTRRCCCRCSARACAPWLPLLARGGGDTRSSPSRGWRARAATRRPSDRYRAIPPRSPRGSPRWPARCAARWCRRAAGHARGGEGAVPLVLHADPEHEAARRPDRRPVGGRGAPR